MADRVYPTAKPTTTTTAKPTLNPTATANRPYPAAKSQLYRPPGYRPSPHHRRRSNRSLCCSCFLWTILLLFLLLVLAAVAAAAIYVVYRPQRPSFSVSALQITQFTLLSSTSLLTTNINFTLTAKNPNKKVTFFYDPTSISISTANDGVSIGDGTLPAFQLGTKNTTVLTSTVATTGQTLDTTSAGQLQTDMKSKGGLSLKAEVDTKMSVKIGKVKTKKVSVRVTCVGIKAGLPTTEVVSTPAPVAAPGIAGSPAPAPATAAMTNMTVTVASPATVSGAKCKVHLRIKIWKWTW